MRVYRKGASYYARGTDNIYLGAYDTQQRADIAVKLYKYWKKHMSKFRELDQKVFAGISDKPVMFRDLFAGDVMTMCETFSHEEPHRVLDRRLRALKKQGLIKYTGKGWVKA